MVWEVILGVAVGLLLVWLALVLVLWRTSPDEARLGQLLRLLPDVLSQFSCHAIEHKRSHQIDAFEVLCSCIQQLFRNRYPHGTPFFTFQPCHP